MAKLKKRGSICKLINSKRTKIVKCFDKKGNLIGIYEPKKKKR